MNSQAPAAAAKPETVKAASHVVANELTPNIGDRDFIAGWIGGAINRALEDLAAYTLGASQARAARLAGEQVAPGGGGEAAPGAAHDQGSGRGH